MWSIQILKMKAKDVDEKKPDLSSLIAKFKKKIKC